MRKKDFVAIAEVLHKYHNDYCPKRGPIEQAVKIPCPIGDSGGLIDRMADTLSANYPLFDRKRFIDAAF